MDTIIKIDYKAICKQYINDIKYLYGLSDDDIKNLPLDLSVITKWVDKVQEDYLIDRLKNDDLDTVVAIMEARSK